jgi:histidine triad (HIT) family protein
MECIFCRIVAGEIPAEIVFQDNEFLVFRDIHPQAPTHVLIITKAHIISLNEVTGQQEGLLGRLLLTAKRVAEIEGIAGRGYRLSINTGTEGGQLVPHLHLHLLGGRRIDDVLG